MNIELLIKDLIKLKKSGIEEICFCVGCANTNVANDFCYFDTDFYNSKSVLHNGINYINRSSYE